MTSASGAIRVVIPLTIRRRNGRPKILPPEDAGLRVRIPAHVGHPFRRIPATVSDRSRPPLK